LTTELQKIREFLTQPILEPDIQRTRGQLTGALNTTCRDPSAFEVEMLLQEGEIPRNGRKCGYCQVIGTGHNATTCPLRQGQHRKD
jgi:hypothetical protein